MTNRASTLQRAAISSSDICVGIYLRILTTTSGGTLSGCRPGYSTGACSVLTSSRTSSCVIGLEARSRPLLSSLPRTKRSGVSVAPHTTHACLTISTGPEHRAHPPRRTPPCRIWPGGRAVDVAGRGSASLGRLDRGGRIISSAPEPFIYLIQRPGALRYTTRHLRSMAFARSFLGNKYGCKTRIGALSWHPLHSKSRFARRIKKDQCTPP